MNNPQKVQKAQVDSRGYFLPGAALRAILTGEDRLGRVARCAYVHRDGIAISVEQRVRVPGFEQLVPVKTWHLVPCGVEFDARAYGHRKPDAGPLRRLVVHEPQALVHGLKRVEVDYNNNTEAAAERGLSIHTVTLVTPSSGIIREHTIPGVLSGRFTPQPNPYDPLPGAVPDHVWAYGAGEDYAGVVVWGERPL